MRAKIGPLDTEHSRTLKPLTERISEGQATRLLALSGTIPSVNTNEWGGAQQPQRRT